MSTQDKAKGMANGELEYGCIGEVLGHSFSKDIHNALADYDYRLREVARDELDAFMTERRFHAINVTIPYKEAVIPHLCEIDEHARLIGAVNTIVNRDGRLYGYNTDFYGMCRLLEHAGIDPKGKKAVVLGSGGTSKTAYAVLSSLGAAEVIRVSRTKREQSADYEELYRDHADAEILINTTPVGMFPHADGCPVELDRLPRLCGVADAVYNPLRTRLVREARARGIAAEGGLYMLVAQAVRASEIFTDKEYPSGTTDSIYNSILGKKENIVLIGMPASGKSTVGALLCKELGREIIDTDELIVRHTGMPISEIFDKYGEEYFRALEREAVAEAAQRSGIIIATGGGAVLDRRNVDELRSNGQLFFLDRSPELLIPTGDRPLASTRAAITKRYNERYDTYCAAADVRVDGDGTAEEVAGSIIRSMNAKA